MTKLSDEELNAVADNASVGMYLDGEHTAMLVAEIHEHRSLLRHHDSKHHPSIGGVPRISHEAILAFVERVEPLVEEADEKLSGGLALAVDTRQLVAYLSDAVTNLRQLLAERVQAARGLAMEPWPANEPPQYNGRGEPCDMWRGPCSCGAWHDSRRVDALAGTSAGAPKGGGDRG